MFRIYLLTFDGDLRVHFKNYSSTKEGSLYSISLWGKSLSKGINRDFGLSTTKSGVSFFHKIYLKFLLIQEIEYDSLVLLWGLKTLLSILMKREILCYFLFLYYSFLLCSLDS